MSGARLVSALLLAGAALSPVGKTGAPGGAASVREAVRAHRAGHELEVLRELADLLAIPNVASDGPNIERNARALEKALAARGLRTQRLGSAGAPPVVLGELVSPGARETVVLYAHYDGQPVTRSQWSSDPWKPVLRDAPLEAGGREVSWTGLSAPLPPDWRLYARSASDDKAPIVGVLAALDALRAANIPLSVNLKLFLEGEEEAGSPHLADIVSGNAARLGGGLWLLLDGPVHASRRMQLYFGARGVQDLAITVYGPARRLHSGHYGNWAPNPIAELARLVASLRDGEGRILVAGFDDDVRPLTPAERRALAAIPDGDDSLRRELALGRSEGNGEKLSAAILRPALNLRGIAGGAVGPETANAIPTEATASIDFRLVPDQTPERVRRQVEEHVRRQGYAVVAAVPSLEERRASPRIARLEWGPGYPAGRTPIDSPLAAAVTRIVEESAGGPVIRLPSLGGSVPMYLFPQRLGAPAIGVPTVNHDNNQHAADENLRLQNLWDGIEVYAALLARLGKEWP